MSCSPSRPVQVRGYFVPPYCRALPKRHPVPMSVRIASSWQNPAQEITPEFLDQLADDWDTFSLTTPNEMQGENDYGQK